MIDNKLIEISIYLVLIYIIAILYRFIFVRTTNMYETAIYKVSTKIRSIEQVRPAFFDTMDKVLPTKSLPIEEEILEDVIPPKLGVDISNSDDFQILSIRIPSNLLMKPRNDKPTELVIKTKLPSKYVLIDTETKKIYQGTEEGGLFKSWKELT